MISRALDSNNDLIVSKGRFLTVEDGAQTVQAVRCRLLFYLGEWFLDTSAGVPYFQQILTKPADLVNAESIIKTKILTTTGVESLSYFQMSYEGDSSRKLTINYSAETIYGLIDSDEVTINV